MNYIIGEGMDRQIVYGRIPARQLRDISDDPTWIAYSEADFFGALDAGQIDDCAYIRVECYDRNGVFYAYVATPEGFRLADEMIAAAALRVRGQRFAGRTVADMGAIDWTRPAAQTRAARAAKGLRGAPDRSARALPAGGEWS